MDLFTYADPRDGLVHVVVYRGDHIEYLCGLRPPVESAIKSDYTQDITCLFCQMLANVLKESPGDN